MCTSVVSTIQGSKVHMEKLFTAMEYLISILRNGYDFDIEISAVSTTKNTSIQTSYGSSYNSIIHNKTQMKRKQSSSTSKNDMFITVKKSRNINQKLLTIGQKKSSTRSCTLCNMSGCEKFACPKITNVYGLPLAKIMRAVVQT